MGVPSNWACAKKPVARLAACATELGVFHSKGLMMRGPGRWIVESMLVRLVMRSVAGGGPLAARGWTGARVGALGARGCWGDGILDGNGALEIWRVSAEGYGIGGHSVKDEARCGNERWCGLMLPASS